jgi:hypothetical protein
VRSITPLKSASPQITAPVPGSTLLLANIRADGNGGFHVTPQKPVQEISSREAAKLLCCSRGNLSLAVNSRLGQKHLRWRWLTEKKGKRVFDRDSVMAYREALKQLE